MTTHWQQTNDTTDCTSAATVGLAEWRRKAVVGGTAAPAGVSANLAGNANDLISASSQIEPAATQAPAGDYVFRLNVTISNMNVTWDALDLVEISGSGASCSVVQTLGQVTGLGISLGTTGVKTATITLASPVSIDAANDLYFRAKLDNGSMNAQSVAFRHDQLIDTPDFAAAYAGEYTYQHGRSVPTLPIRRGIARAIIDVPVQFITPSVGTDQYPHARNIPKRSPDRGNARLLMDYTPPPVVASPQETDCYTPVSSRFDDWPLKGKVRSIEVDLPYVGIKTRDWFYPATLRFMPEKKYRGRSTAVNVNMPYVGINERDFHEHAVLRFKSEKLYPGRIVRHDSPQPYVGINVLDYYESDTQRYSTWPLSGKVKSQFAEFEPVVGVSTDSDTYNLYANRHRPRQGKGSVREWFVAPPYVQITSSADWPELHSLRFMPHKLYLGCVKETFTSPVYVQINPLFDWPLFQRLRPVLNIERGRVLAAFAPYEPALGFPPDATLDWYVLAALYQTRVAGRGSVGSQHIALPIVVSVDAVNDWNQQHALRFGTRPLWLGRINQFSVQLPYTGIHPRDWFVDQSVRFKPEALYRGRSVLLDTPQPYVGINPRDFYEPGALRFRFDNVRRPGFVLDTPQPYRPVLHYDPVLARPIRSLVRNVIGSSFIFVEPAVQISASDFYEPGIARPRGRPPLRGYVYELILPRDYGLGSLVCGTLLVYAADNALIAIFPSVYATPDVGPADDAAPTVYSFVDAAPNVRPADDSTPTVYPAVDATPDVEEC